MAAAGQQLPDNGEALGVAAGGVVLTTVTDVIGFLSFLGLALVGAGTGHLTAKIAAARLCITASLDA